MLAENYRWTCGCCGEARIGLPMDLGYERPDLWDYLNEGEKGHSSRDSDFCHISFENGEEYFFILCALSLPVPEIEDEFRFGVWVSVSERNFYLYSVSCTQKEFETADGLSDSGHFGYLGNEIPGFAGSQHLPVDVYFGGGDDRPRVELHFADHPLVEAQRHGVNAAQVERWVAPFIAH